MPTGWKKCARVTVAASAMVVAALASVAGTAQTAGSTEPFTLVQAAAAFGARPSVEHISISPDGKLVAIVEPFGARALIVKVADQTTTDGLGKGIAAVDGDPERIEWCRWSGPTRLLCQIYASTPLPGGKDFTYASRLMAMDADGKNIQMLRVPQRIGAALGTTNFGGSVIDWNTGKDGHVLMVRRYVPESTLGTHLAQREEGLAVDDVNTVDLKSSRVERARPSALEFISDGRGRVRIIGAEPDKSVDGYSLGRIRYTYRTREGNDWLVLGDYDDARQEGFVPYHVDSRLDVACGLKKVNGRFAAFTMSLDGKRTEQLVLDQGQVDVDGFVTIGREERVIGVTFATDRREVVYIDPNLKQLASSLSKALPNLPLIRFVDSSQDERKLVIWAGSDVDPGRYYLLDRNTRGLTEIAYSRAGLLNRPLATVKAIEVRAADGTMIPAYLTLPPGSNGKNLPAIVMPHGGPSARDEWGFDWLAQFWANRGYAVLQPNFRGSSGYGDEWFRDNGFKSWRVAIGDVTDSGKWLIDQGIANPRKLAIFGWSYGGYAALQSAVVQPDLFRAVVAVAPVTDLERLKQDYLQSESYLLAKDFIGSGTHVEEGSPARQVGKITAPILLFHGSYDANVRVGQSQLMADRLRDGGKPGRLVTYDKLDHYLEDSAARQDMLSQSATFIEQSFSAMK